METLFSTQPLGNIFDKAGNFLSKVDTRINTMAPVVQKAQSLISTVRGGGVVPGTNVMYNPALKSSGSKAPAPNNNKTLLVVGGVLVAGFIAYKFL